MNKGIVTSFKDWSDPSKARFRQQLVFMISLVLFFLLVSTMFFATGSSQEEIPFSLDEPKGKITIADVTDGATAQDRWLQMAESKLQNIDKVSQQLEAVIQDNQQLKEELRQLQANSEEVLDHKVIVDGYYQQIEMLHDRIDELGRQQHKQNDTYPSSILPKKIDDSGPFTPAQSATYPFDGGIQDVTFTLQGGRENFHYYNTNEFLPAGSYVSAVVISGVDASVGISSQTDPRPILFRINGNAFSALHENDELEIDIKGCVVTGAASGDLSSEKVFVRLLKMTCANDKGSVIETNVKGYASAVGKAGVRGPVTSREGDLVIKSFFAGLAGGVGSGVAQKMATPATVVGGIATQDPKTKDIIGQGIGQGIESSTDRVAQYLIDRAEQYQPVITIAAGIDVELVFHEGVYLDGRKRRK